MPGTASESSFAMLSEHRVSYDTCEFAQPGEGYGFDLVMVFARADRRRTRRRRRRRARAAAAARAVREREHRDRAGEAAQRVRQDGAADARSSRVVAGHPKLVHRDDVRETRLRIRACRN